MTERIVAFAENAKLSVKGHVAIQACMHKQIIPMFDSPWQIGQQPKMLCWQRRFESVHIIVCNTVRFKRGLRTIMMSPAASKIDVVRSVNQTKCPSHCQFMISAKPSDLFVLLHKITEKLHSSSRIRPTVHKVTNKHDPPFVNIWQFCQLRNDFSKLRSLTMHIANYGHGTINACRYRCHFTLDFGSGDRERPTGFRECPQNSAIAQ